MKPRFLILFALLLGATATPAQPLMLRCATNKTVACFSAWTFDPPLGYINACPPTGTATVSVLSTVTNGPCPLIVTRTWQVTDDCGNTATCSQSVTNTDTRAPEIMCATNPTVECGTPWTFPGPTAFDDCTATADLIFSVLSTVTNLAPCPTLFSATRVWQVADLCGNTATCTQFVAVVDTKPPVLSCQCLQGPWLTVTACSNAIPDLCLLVNNCATDCSTITCTQSPPAGTIVLPGIYSITISVTDCASNSASCLVDFTVVAPPLRILCPLPFSVPCGTPFALNPPPAQSLCCGTNVTVTALSTTTNGSPCLQFVQRVWLAADCYGQTATCTQTVAIVDNTPPTFCVDSSVSNLVSNGSFEINTACPSNFSGQITFATGWSSPTLGSSDYFHPCAPNAALGAPNNIVGSQLAFGGVAYAGIHAADTQTSVITPLREYIQTKLTSTLVGGRTYNVSFRVSLSDPATKAVDNLGAYLSTTAPSSVTWAPLGNLPQVQNPSGSFLTDKTGWTLIQGDFTAAGGEEYLTIGNFYDNAGTPTVPLLGSTNWAYYYIDDVRVVETCCRSRIVECPATGIFEPPPARDDCLGTNVTVTLLTGTSTSPGCTQVHTLVWKAADPCGNTTTCTQRVTVVDTTPPVITCPGNILRNICTNSVKVHYKATASDACSLPVTVVCVPPSGSTFSLGPTTVNCTATDACGHSNSCAFTVTVVNSVFWQLLPRGVNDCYAQGGLELAGPGPCLITAQPGAWKNFDLTATDQRVGQTWNFPLTWNILAAQLLLRAGPPVNGCAGLSFNDTISLGLAAPCSASPPDWQWSRFFGNGNASPGLVPAAQWCNRVNCQYMFVFNLASLVPAAGPPTISLLPLMNSTKRLDLFVQDDTTVDFANLRVQICPPQVLGGIAVTLTNAQLVIGPAAWCLALANPELPFSADLRLGDPAGLRLPIDPLALAGHPGASLEFGGGDLHGGDLPRLAFSEGAPGLGEVHLNGLPPGVPVIDLEVLVGGAVVQAVQVPATDGMLVANFTATDPLVEFALANRNELLATLVAPGSTRISLRVRLPGYAGGFPGARLRATGIEEIGVQQPELQMNRGATGDGAKTVFVKFNDRASVGEISGGQAVASPLGSDGGGTIELSASFPPTNEFRAITPPAFGNFNPVPGHAVVSSFVRGLIGGEEVEVDRLDFTRTPMGEWDISWNGTHDQTRGHGRVYVLYGPSGHTNVSIYVPTGSNVVVTVPDLPAVLGKLGGLTPCRRIIWPTLVPARVAGQTLEVTEIRILLEVQNNPVTALTGLRLAATGAEHLVLSEMEFGPETFRLERPELVRDEVIIRWNGYGGVLEEAATVRGPWSATPGQFGQTLGEYRASSRCSNCPPNNYWRIKGR